MISDDKLLWGRLAENALELLLNDLEANIGTLHTKHKEEVNAVMQNEIRWALTRFSTTEIRKVILKLLQNNKGLKSVIDWESINKMDDWLMLDDPSIHQSLQLKNQILQLSKKYPYSNIQKVSQKGHLAQLANSLRRQNDPRKMRRLKRKETKRLKRGCRLFDSNEKII